MSRQSGHHRIMGARWALVMMVLDADLMIIINLDTLIGITSFTVFFQLTMI
jgi:hypothetical protein